MAYLHTKTSNLGIFVVILYVYILTIRYNLLPFGTIYGHLVYFGVIWYILGLFGIFRGHFVYFSPRW
jgi:hypothetical protein